jgi:hypothetical protein
MIAAAILHHYGIGNCDFTIRATGKLEWRGPGVQPTEEQIEQWIEDYKKHLQLQEQRALCKKYLDDSDKKINGDWPYVDDIPTWETARAEWRTIIKSLEVEVVKPPPFGD